MAEHCHHGPEHDPHQHEGHCHHGHEDPLHAPDGIEPALCSFTETRPAAGGGEELARRYTDAVEALCAWAEQADALVGHIKLILSRGEESLWLSSTGDGVSARHSGGWAALSGGEYQLHFTAILYGVETSALEEQVRLTI